MRKLAGVLILSCIFLFSSGFGAVENNSYTQNELKAKDLNENFDPRKKLVVSETFTGNTEAVLEKETTESSRSLSEKLGAFLVNAFVVTVKAVSAFLISLIQ